VTAPVGLVIVSHSARLAAGVVELAGQMAPGVPLVAAGGRPGGGLGTDFAAVADALARADVGSGVVVLYDLGSARMTADLAVEASDDPTRAVVAEAPLVEGAVAAAVAAAGGASLAAVAAAAAGDAPRRAPESGPPHEKDIVLANGVGLHARPAAMLSRTLTGLTADVTVRFGDHEADARSVLALLGLGARKGDRLTVAARGADAEEALTRIERLADDNFGE
jgi:PTS hybrid protein